MRCWNKGNRKWEVKIQKDGKNTHLGYFDDEEETARPHDVAAVCIGRPLNWTGLLEQ